MWRSDAPDPVERWMVRRLESVVETGFLWLMILKELNHTPQSGSELRDSIAQSFHRPHNTTLYTTLYTMRAMRMIQPSEKHGLKKRYAITDKGRALLERGEIHLKSLMTTLWLMG